MARFKFEQAVPAMIALIRNGNDFERKAAEADMLDIAKVADLYIQISDAAAEAKARPYVDELMKRLTKKPGDPEGGQE